MVWPALAPASDPFSWPPGLAAASEVNQSMSNRRARRAAWSAHRHRAGALDVWLVDLADLGHAPTPLCAAGSWWSEHLHEMEPRCGCLTCRQPFHDRSGLSALLLAKPISGHETISVCGLCHAGWGAATAAAQRSTWTMDVFAASTGGSHLDATDARGDDVLRSAVPGGALEPTRRSSS